MIRRTKTLSLLAAALLFGGVAGFAPGLFSSPSAAQEIAACKVVDGDTLRCGAERVRLLGIDAPELPGHCAQGRDCAPGDGFAATESLKAALEGPIRIRRVGSDRYGRTLALVSGAKGDLSCWQLKRRQAIYKPKWDNGRQLAAICPAAR